MIEFDETHSSPDMCNQMHQEVIVGENEEFIEIAVAKSGQSCTIVGGSDMAGNSLPMYVIFPAKDTLDANYICKEVQDPVTGGWDLIGAPESSKTDPRTGKPFKAKYTHNESGGMTNDMGVRYLKEVILPFAHDRSPTNFYILILDGHSSHLSTPFLKMCRENYIEVILRIPHTTDKTQGADVVNYLEYKSQETKNKADLLTARVVASSGKDYSLNLGDMPQYSYPAWSHAFQKSLNQLAWKKTGYNPFTRVPVMAQWRKEYNKEQGLKVCSQGLHCACLLSVDLHVCMCTHTHSHVHVCRWPCRCTARTQHKPPWFRSRRGTPSSCSRWPPRGACQTRTRSPPRPRSTPARRP